MNRNVYRTICSVILVALFLAAGITLRVHTQAHAAAGVPVLTHKTSSSSWASASPLPFPSWWSGTCDSGHHPGSYQLGTASYRGLVACGPLPIRGANDVRVYFPGATIYVNEWQCVELSMRYLYLAYGVAPYLADGSQVVWNYPGSLLQKIHNDTPGQAPQAGDVLSYGATSTHGHTSIVMSANYASPGNGTITVLEENNSSDGQSVLQVSNWHVRSTIGSGVSGWLHDPRSANPSVVGMAPTHDSKGYQIIGADGSLSAFGDAINYGSLKGLPLNAPVVGMAATPDGMGYWLVAADGGIFPFGSAIGFGSLGNLHLNAPVVGMAATHSGNGYWLVAADGGIFPFGDARGLGSLGNIRLNAPVVGMAATPDGMGYWLVAADGGIFPFGDAQGLGSLA